VIFSLFDYLPLTNTAVVEVHGDVERRKRIIDGDRRRASIKDGGEVLGGSEQLRRGCLRSEVQGPGHVGAVVLQAHEDVLVVGGLGGEQVHHLEPLARSPDREDIARVIGGLGPVEQQECVLEEQGVGVQAQAATSEQQTVDTVEDALQLGRGGVERNDGHASAGLLQPPKTRKKKNKSEPHYFVSVAQPIASTNHLHPSGPHREIVHHFGQRLVPPPTAAHKPALCVCRPDLT
jgi:hypothetical protein